MDKKYLIRIYIFSEEMGAIVNDAIDVDLFTLTQNGLKCLVSLGIAYLPLNNYGEFIITCPNCGERIDDEMILHTYDENVLSGYNILCNRKDCGTQMAKVQYIGG